MRLLGLALLTVTLFTGNGCGDDGEHGQSNACSFRNECQPNVLLLFVDDLRTDLGSYGALHVHSPHIDALAAKGVVFERALAQMPVCGASRASLLTGLRPTHTRFFHFFSRADVDAPEATTLPELFRNAGFTTIANGKIFHIVEDSADSWSEPPFRVGPDNTDQKFYAVEENRRLFEELGMGPAFEAADVEDAAYPGGAVAEKTIRDLRRFAATGEAFFLAAGFWKPHLPFNAPQRYWDLYEREEVPIATNPRAPDGAPAVALHDSLELRGQYLGIPPGPLPDDLARTLAHGYLASVSYTDALIGRMLGELEALDIADKTIVVLVGDHGLQLGEHAMWAKHNNFEVSLRTALIIRAPGFASGRAQSVVELLDLYPTLVELAALEAPHRLAGESLLPQLEDPGHEGKGWAVSQYHSLISFDPGPWFGESIRTDRWMYTEWLEEDGRVRERMLYDHNADPAEDRNVADEVAPTVIQELSTRLREILAQGATPPPTSP